MIIHKMADSDYAIFEWWVQGMHLSAVGNKNQNGDAKKLCENYINREHWYTYHFFIIEVEK